MKYVFLIVRHIFPRRRWVVIEQCNIVRSKDKTVIGTQKILRDQFGNLKEFKRYIF